MQLLDATLIAPLDDTFVLSDDTFAFPMDDDESERESAPRESAAGELKTLRDFDPILSSYRQPSLLRSIWQIVSTLVPFFVTWTLAYLSLSVSYWLTAALIIPTGLLLVRIFIIQHDCGHRSFFKSKKLNDAVGFGLGILTLTPYEYWRRAHAAHHATSGDLDRRGKSGEIYTMTVNEYRNASWKHRTLYRLYRNPLVLFCLAPLFQFMIRQRFAFELPKAWKKERRSIYLTNIAIVSVAALMCWLVGTWEFFIIQFPVMAVAAQVGVWLFYMQHQYEDAFWQHGEDWDYVQAALAGSSHYRLPKILQWFSGNIGLHHIHHLDSRIPNYRLQACHDNNPELQDVNEFSLLSSISCFFVRLWDEDQQKMVTFKAARQKA